MSGRLPDQDARDAIRTELETTLVVEAAAGTGKTTELVARMLALVSAGKAELASIVAVTFTEKAAGEMKLRLRAGVEAARTSAATTADERRRLDLALQQLEQAHISTIHGFCADLLRERPIEAAVDPMFEMAADDDRERIFDEAFDDWFQKQLEAPGDGVRRVLRRRSRERDARGPREALRRAGLDLVDQRDFDAPWQKVPMERESEIDGVLGELEKLGALATQSSGGEDWLQKGLAEVQRFMEELGRRERVRGRDYDGLEAELRDLGKKRSWGWKGYGKNYGKGILRSDVLDQRARVKGKLDRVLSDLDASLASSLHAEMRPLVASYEALKGRAGKLDFLDLLVRARDLLATDTEVRAAMQARFTHLLVDEFQDTDPLQAEILLLLAGDDPKENDLAKIRVVPGKLFVVGDPKQSIYRFRRADVALYERTKQRLAAQGAKVVHLVTSFRAAPQIQRFVNEAFARVMKGGEDGSQASYVALQSPPDREEVTGRPTIVALPVPRPYSDYGKIVTWKVDESLPDAVGAFVEWLVTKSGWTIGVRDQPGERRPIEARHICLLFKRFSSFGEDKTRAYVRALEARSLPHVLMGGRSYHAREEVMALRNALSAVEWPDDELSVFATLRGPFFAVGDDLLLAYKDRVGSLHLLRNVDRGTLPGPLADVWDAIAILRKLHYARNERPIADTLARLLDETRAHAGVAIWPTGEQALANILRVLDLARRFEATAATSFRAFVQRMQDDAARGGAPEAPVVEEGTDGVRLMTVHRAKGLEFPVVILVDPLAPMTMKDPSRYTDPDTLLCAMPLCNCTPRELDDHREEVLRRDYDEAVRLGYVAATRARDLLVVPAFGDGAQEGWLDMLNPSLYPDPRDLRVSTPAPGCPPFIGEDTVMDWPEKAQRSVEGAVMPGLHRTRGGHEVVWWDPVALDLGKENEAGLRQRRLLEADKEGTAAQDGIKQHEAWKEARDTRLARGGAPTLRVRTVTAASKDAPQAAEGDVEIVTVPGRREGRPHHRRFGTLVHAVLAEVPLDAAPDAIARLSKKQARLLGAPEDEAEGAAFAVAAALAHPLLRSAAASASCRREAFVSITEDDGELVEGVVDLAFEDGGAWIVVDYKTDIELATARVETYKAQVRAYASAIARATGAPARGLLLRV